MAGPAWIVPAAIAAGTSLINAWQNWRATKVNQRFIREQNAYNTPKSQMMRFQSAGLNPHLVYGQGNPGNQSQISPVETGGRLGSDAANAYDSTLNAQTQASVGAARVEQSKAMTAVNKLQAEVMSRNPLLNDGAFEAIINNLKDTAREKAANASIAEQNKWISDATAQSRASKIFAEIKVLDQQFDLQNQDKQIKAEILNSKRFQNSILEVQEKFIKDGDVGPQQILEFVKLLLLRIKPR